MSISRRLKKWTSTIRADLRAWKARYFTDHRHALAVMAIMKNEGWNVEEWIAHYIQQGADHLFIIDNGSTDDLSDKIKRSVYRQKISLLSYPKKHMQSNHYRRAFRSQKIRQTYRWLLVVDADEFCFARNHETLPEALRELERFDVIYMQWTYFGCEGQVDHPQSLRTHLLWRHEQLGSHWNTKWFAKTDVLRGKAMSIHKVRGADSAKTITANDVFQLNHYQTQSLKFWTQVKMIRGDAALPEWEQGRSLTVFDEFNEKAVLRDTLLAERLTDGVASARFIENA